MRGKQFRHVVNKRLSPFLAKVSLPLRLGIVGARREADDEEQHLLIFKLFRLAWIAVMCKACARISVNETNSRIELIYTPTVNLQVCKYR